jgi:uncharacterized protein YcfJ
MKKIKKHNIIGTANKQYNSYKEGSLIGGLIGGLSALILGKKIILFTIIGAVAGGYISYEVNKDNSEIINLDKFKE